MNRHLNRSKFLIKPFILLTRKNPLKLNGFCANRVTRLGYCNPARLQFLWKLFFWVYFSIFILFKIGLFDNYQWIKNYKGLKITLFGLFFYFYNLFGCCNLILLLHYEFMSLRYALVSRILRHLFILIILGVLIFNLIIYFMISQT